MFDFRQGFPQLKKDLWAKEVYAKAEAIRRVIGERTLSEIRYFDPRWEGDYGMREVTLIFHARGEKFPQGTWVRVTARDGDQRYRVRMQRGHPSAPFTVDERFVPAAKIGHFLRDNV